MTEDARANTVVARVLRLKRFAMFGDLSPAALTSLAERVEERAFASGEELLGGDGSPRLHFVLRGEVDVRRFGRSSASRGDRDVVGDLDVLAAAPRERLFARAVSPTCTLSIDRAGLLAAQEDSFPLQRAMLKRIGCADLEARRRFGWNRSYEGRGGGAGATALLDDTAGRGELLELAHRVSWLRGTRELGGLRIRTLGRLAAASELSSVPAGEPLWRHGDSADFAVQVLRGSVRCQTDDGAAFSIGSDSLLGLSEVLAEAERWCDVSAASEVLAMRLSVEDILDELEDDTDVAVELMTALAAGVVELEGLAARAGSNGGSGAT
jgi:CRP-like cAMP-binding protein